jgi:hypothetical protein
MWIASTIGFSSVVRDRQTKGGVLVRARAKADIDNLSRRFSKSYPMTRPRGNERSIAEVVNIWLINHASFLHRFAQIRGVGKLLCLLNIL